MSLDGVVYHRFVSFQGLENYNYIEVETDTKAPTLIILENSFLNWIKQLFFKYVWKPENRRFHAVNQAVEGLYDRNFKNSLDRAPEGELQEIKKTLEHLDRRWAKHGRDILWIKTANAELQKRLTAIAERRAKVAPLPPPVADPVGVLFPLLPPENAKAAAAVPLSPLLHGGIMGGGPIPSPTPSPASHPHDLAPIPEKMKHDAAVIKKDGDSKSELEWGDILPPRAWEGLCQEGPLTIGSGVLVQRNGPPSYYQYVRIDKIEGDSVTFFYGSDSGTKKDSRSFRIIKPRMEGLVALEKRLLKARAEALKVDGPLMGEAELEEHAGKELFGSRTGAAVKFSAGLTLSRSGNLLSIAGRNYTMLTGRITSFDIPLASIGSSIDREIILLDPNSKILNEHAEALKLKLESMGKGFSTRLILQQVMEYVRSKIFDISKDSVAKTDKIFKEELANAGTPKYAHISHPGRMVPAIPLDLYVSRKIGVCRHHALVTCFLIHRLVKSGFLLGTVQHIRDNIPAGAHIWAIFTPKDNPKEAWHLDTLWDLLVNFSVPFLQEYLARDYGNAAIERQVRMVDETRKKQQDGRQ